jgi:uncharacterized repeat protein (TIGR03803 family)
MLWLAGSAQAVDKETVLYNFSNSSGGSGPFGGLVMDQSGNMYGATLTGEIFEMSPNGAGGWNFSELTTCGQCEYPVGPLVMDHVGNLYGSDFFGYVFEVSPNGSGGWTPSTVYAFSGGTDGSAPSTVILDNAGNLYGVNASGGSSGVGYVFELSPISGGGWSLTHLHDFDGTDGGGGSAAAGVVGALIMDGSGNLYGTAYSGGNSTTCSSGCGVVFKLTNNAGVWTEAVLYNFDGTHGANPDAPLLMDASGNLYGTTTAGGPADVGVVFETSFHGITPYTRVLYSFTGTGADGAVPLAGLIMDGSGSLYGTTEAGGGSFNCSVGTINGCGTAFKLTRSGIHWKESILHDFKAEGDGGFPGTLISDDSGNLYSDGFVGGLSNIGVVFELSPQTASTGK